MDYTTFCFALQGVGLALLFCIVCIQRLLWRGGQHRGKKRRRFYPTNYTMGNAFQQLQLFVAPNAEYTIEEKLKEDAEDDDEGGSDDPAKHLERQLKRIRRGERVDKLTTMLREDQ
jgi:hypothetical protein